MRPSTNENQIVNVITRMQKQLDQAKTTIRELMRERDEYRGEAKMLRQILAQTQRSVGYKTSKNKVAEGVDNDLLDFTQYSEADEDFTQQLPTLNVAKVKPNLKATSEKALLPQQRPHKQLSSKDVPTTQAPQHHSSHLQPLGAKRQPLREISENQNQQRSQPSPQRGGKKVIIEDEYVRDTSPNNTVQTNSRPPTRNITYLSNIPDNQPFTTLRNQLEAERLNRQLGTTKEVDRSRQDTARSLRAATAPPLERQSLAAPEDKEVTAASNTSRRRRRASDTAEIDEGMTSAYLLPDITIAKPQPEQQQLLRPSLEAALSSEQPQPGQLSEEAKDFLHSVDPDHIVSCVHCRRLLRLPQKLQARKEAGGWDWCMVIDDK